LHTNTGCLAKKGTNIAAIVDDIDSQPRINPPCIGADEFLPPAAMAGIYTIDFATATNYPGGSNFQSFNEAVQALKCSGISASVTFNVATGTYTEQVAIPLISGVTAIDTITFQAGNISEDYYNFIVTLQAETGFQTPLFSGPPANVKSNISNGATGFFAVYSVAYSTRVFQP